MISCGLLGKKLSHSYSPAIHNMLGGYEYKLYEKAECEVEAFIKSGEWHGLNVTIPYKKTVVPFMDEISETVRKTGSVNTIVRRPDGTLYGDNTDVCGFTGLVRRSGISVRGEKTLVLGSGGASAAVLAALDELGAGPVVISRSGENNYGNLDRHADAGIIVNTTPLGMYPETGVSPLDLRMFPSCRGVFDVIYNPARTELLLQAERLGIPGENGLYMLVAQAKRSSELFMGRSIPDSETERIYKHLDLRMRNIVLIGMPGCGKSTIAAELGKRTGLTVIDCDDEITRRTGETPEQIITSRGEPVFRDIESDILLDLGKRSGAVIATGGGAVVRGKNYDFLHQNGTIVWLRRDIGSLAQSGRPLSQKFGARALFEQREPLYRKFADITVDLADTPAHSSELILSALGWEEDNK